MLKINKTPNTSVEYNVNMPGCNLGDNQHK